MDALRVGRVRIAVPSRAHGTSAVRKVLVSVWIFLLELFVLILTDCPQSTPAMPALHVHTMANRASLQPGNDTIERITHWTTSHFYLSFCRTLISGLAVNLRYLRTLVLDFLYIPRDLDATRRLRTNKDQR